MPPLLINITPSSGQAPLNISYNIDIINQLNEFKLHFGDGDIYLTPLSTTTVLSKSGFYSTTLNVIGYTIRSIIAANTLSAGGEYIQLELRRPYEGTLFITNVSIVERDGSTANGITIPTEITFNNGQSGVTLSSTGDLSTFSDFVYFPFDRTKSYLIIYDISPSSTSTSPSRWIGGSSYLKANTQSWNQQNLTSTTTSSFVFFIRRIHAATRPPQTTFTTSHTYYTPGTYSLYAEGYTEFATKETYSLPNAITVTPQPVTSAFIYTQNSNIITFNDTSTGVVNEWYWTFGDGSSSYEQHPNHTYYTPGTYQVILYSSNQYQYDWSSSYVNITQILTPPSAYFTPARLDIINPTLPYSVTFTNLSTPTFGCTYNWTIDGSTYTTTDATHSFATHGVYDVGLTVTNALGSSSRVYNDAIRLTRKSRTMNEVVGSADTFSTFGVQVFMEYATGSDLPIVYATILPEGVYFIQREIPNVPGIDEWGVRHLYSTINEWGVRIFTALNSWGHKILHNSSSVDRTPLRCIDVEIFEETVIVSDDHQFDEDPS